MSKLDKIDNNTFQRLRKIRIIDFINTNATALVMDYLIQNGEASIHLNSTEA